MDLHHVYLNEANPEFYQVNEIFKKNDQGADFDLQDPYPFFEINNTY